MLTCKKCSCSSNMFTRCLVHPGGVASREQSHEQISISKKPSPEIHLALCLQPVTGKSSAVIQSHRGCVQTGWAKRKKNLILAGSLNPAHERAPQSSPLKAAVLLQPFYCNFYLNRRHTDFKMKRAKHVGAAAPSGGS